jgi:dienelactone hydrolase
MDGVTIRRDIEYRGTLTMDLYDPPDSIPGQPIPAVIFVGGFPDAGFQTRLGCKQKEMASYVSWSRLVAASGMIAITYTNSDPAADAVAVLRYVRENAASLNVDANRIGIWSCSGNVPTALALLMSEALTCAVLCYGFMLDLDDSTAIAEAQKQWGFANPSAGKSVDDLPSDLPLLIVRAGKDEFPHVNEMIDRFASHALARNLPMTIVNHASGPHSFDLFDDTEMSREVMRQILEFMRFHLLTRVTIDPG